LEAKASSATNACPAARLSPPWSLPAARQGLLLAARRTGLFGFDLALLLLPLLGLSTRHASPCVLLASLSTRSFLYTRFIMQFPTVSLTLYTS